MGPSPVTLELGVPGQIMPPASAAVKFARRAEADGFDAVWWPDHLMGWHPDSLWTPDLTPLADSQPNPHTYFDPLVMMGAVGAQTTRLRVGVVVTDLIRRHPAVLAQTMLTLDHLTCGRAILGLGSGEQLNIAPYGLPWDKPVARLSEGIDVIRLLWQAERPVDFEGRFFALRRAVLGLAPYGNAPPQIWTAAHGPRMLEITGRKADGWLPTKMTPAQYAASLEAIRAAARDGGRDPVAIVPALLGYVLAGPDEETVRRLTEQPLVRALCVLLPAEVFRQLGAEPPLTAAGDSGSGFHDFIPTAVARDKALQIVAAIPPAVVRHYAFCGTPDQIAEQIREYSAAGLRHLVMWNITAFGDPALAKYSFAALRQLRAELARLAMDARDIVDAYFAAVNAEDWSAMAELWEPGAELTATGARPRHGREDILAYYPRVLEGYAEHEDRPVRRITEGSTVVVEIRFTGRTADGRAVTFDAVDVFDLASSRIRKLSTWYDTAAVLQQLRGQVMTL